ncbi:unnamed protein product [Oreochromis niloticus]|nr:unnamed protein product [Mustela putorius furo]
MALLSLQPPAVFLDCPGEPKIPFTAWKKLFDNYLLAIGGDDFAAERKRALLIHCLGTEGQRIYSALPLATDDYEGSVKALETYFHPKVNVVAERYRFRQRAQAVGESTDHYVAALRELVKQCKFGAMENEMLRDQLVEKTNNARIRERLLMEEDLTLDRALEIARRTEAAIADAKAIAVGETKPVAAVQVQKKMRKPKYKAAKKADTALTCYRCGSADHKANDKSCPAKDCKCNTCGKIGHFSRVCKSSHKPVNEVTVPEMCVLTVDSCVSSDPAKLMCPVTVTVPNTAQACTVKLLVDTGSGISILPEHVYSTNFGSVKLSNPAVQLITYSKEKLDVLGCLRADITYNGKSASTDLYIVRTGTPILGMDLVTALQLHIKGGQLVLESPKVCATLQQTSALPAHCKQECESPSAFGCAKDFVHKVKVRPEVKPIQQKLRRLPLSVREAVSAELKNLEEHGIIEKIDASEWVSPIVVTRRKTGGIRMCVDLREPNKAVVVDSHPLPLIEDILSELRGAVMFSTLDLKSAYHQLTLHEESRGLTAFITHEGLYQYCRVPYGLSSAPAVFQKMMTQILRGQKGVQCYLDDVIIYGTSEAEHEANLRAVLHRINNAGLKLNVDKCQLRQTTLSFLGQKIGPEGLLPDDSHVTAILHAPPPTDPATLRSFLGLSAWYSKFVPNYATVVEPMRALLRKDCSFHWNKAAQVAFDQVKKLIVHSPALVMFDPSKPTIVSTDASDYGVGAVLTQLDGNNAEQTVAFASRSLSDAERKYSIVEKEALACVWAAEKWRTWLWGRKFLLRTDHQALTTLLTTKGNNRAGLRIARWSARLLEFDYEVEYRTGSLNHVADCLSRLPLPETDMACAGDVESVAAILTDLSAVSEDDFQSACKACPVFTKLRVQIQKGWPARKTSLEPDLQPYFPIRHELAVMNECIVRGTHRLLVPESLQKKLTDIAHETHQGIVRTKQRLRELYWWPKMDCHIETMIKNCATCRQNDKSTVTHDAPLQPIPFPAAAWEKVSVDIIGPFEIAPSDCRFAITLVDYFSKWPEVAFAPRADAATIIQFLSVVFSREGNPKTLISDNGSQFLSAEFADFLKSRGIQHLRSSVYYPRANGEVERFNRCVKDCLQTASIQGQPWKSFLRTYLMDYRATPHSTTGVSPSELLHGRRMRTKLQVMDMPVPQTERHTMCERVKNKQMKMKEYTDARRHAKPSNFQPGDKFEAISLPYAYRLDQVI